MPERTFSYIKLEAAALVIYRQPSLLMEVIG
jgi:hypothetical protein